VERFFSAPDSAVITFIAIVYVLFRGLYKRQNHAEGKDEGKVHYNLARGFSSLGSRADKLRRITFPLPVFGISSMKYRPPVSHL
jgi:hypothetical protein